MGLGATGFGWVWLGAACWVSGWAGGLKRLAGRVGWRLPDSVAFSVVRWGLNRHLTAENPSPSGNPLPTAPRLLAMPHRSRLEVAVLCVERRVPASRWQFRVSGGVPRPRGGNFVHRQAHPCLEVAIPCGSGREVATLCGFGGSNLHYIATSALQSLRIATSALGPHRTAISTPLTRRGRSGLPPRRWDRTGLPPRRRRAPDQAIFRHSSSRSVDLRA